MRLKDEELALYKQQRQEQDTKTQRDLEQKIFEIEEKRIYFEKLEKDNKKIMQEMGGYKKNLNDLQNTILQNEQIRKIQ